MHLIFPAKNFCDKAREMLLTRERSLETWCQGFLLGTDHICSPLPGTYPNPTPRSKTGIQHKEFKYSKPLLLWNGQ